MAFGKDLGKESRKAITARRKIQGMVTARLQVQQGSKKCKARVRQCWRERKPWGKR